MPGLEVIFLIRKKDYRKILIINPNWDYNNKLNFKNTSKDKGHRDDSGSKLLVIKALLPEFGSPAPM